jgi:two-component system chemotaxis response regulator CheY
VLDFADYKPEGTLYIIPVRLEECEPPRRLRAWQYADYFEGQRERAFERLLVSLKRRAESLEIKAEIHIPADLDSASIAKVVSKEDRNKNYCIRVLIVDDMDFTREQYNKMLGDALDIAVVGEAANGKDAIVMFDRLKPDIVLMDTHMPLMNGISATKIIVKKHPGAKIIICSIHNDPEIIREAMVAGALDYLEIPFDKTVLTDAIRHLVD